MPFRKSTEAETVGPEAMQQNTDHHGVWNWVDAESSLGSDLISIGRYYKCNSPGLTEKTGCKDTGMLSGKLLILCGVVWCEVHTNRDSCEGSQLQQLYTDHALCFTL